MAATKDIGIVLRRLDYSETSQVLAIFCRETGLQRLIAKGIKRGTKTRVATGADLLELGYVVYVRRPGSEAQLSTLTEWRQEEMFAGVRKTLAGWYAGQYAAERTAQSTHETDPHPALFDALVSFLRTVGERAVAAALVDYLIDLLREIGLTPECARCVGCGAEETTFEYFSSRQGGVICRDCEPAQVEKRRVTAGVLALISESRGAELDAAEAGLLRGAFELLDYHLTETLGRPSRVTAMLRNVTVSPRRRAT